MECAHGVAWFLLFLHPCRTTFPCRFLFVLGIIENNCQSLVPERNKTLSPSDLSNYQCTTKKGRKKKERNTPTPIFRQHHLRPIVHSPTPFSILPHFANPLHAECVRKKRTYCITQAATTVDGPMDITYISFSFTNIIL
ncbi:hypothetical protein F5H01DRAFT_347571 [Linnemannia elongata]|nr:hypothetical protein F5H01DRAFT_347571 [Linnemannia elongata]